MDDSKYIRLAEDWIDVDGYSFEVEEPWGGPLRLKSLVDIYRAGDGGKQIGRVAIPKRYNQLVMLKEKFVTAVQSEMEAKGIR